MVRPLIRSNRGHFYALTCVVHFCVHGSLQGIKKAPKGFKNN